MLMSRHVPHLDDIWDFVAGVSYLSRTHGMWLTHTHGMWIISQDGFALARSFANARHPNTVLPGEWEICTVYPDGWEWHADFAVTLASGIHTLDELGHAVSLRVPLRQPVSFASDGVVHQSGVNNGGGRHCNLCVRIISANNFVSQHMRGLHWSEWSCRRECDG